MPHDQQAVEQTKRDCRDDEQIHRRDAVGMIEARALVEPGERIAAQLIFKFSADSLPRFGTTSKLTFAPSARPV